MSLKGQGQDMTQHSNFLRNDKFLPMSNFILNYDGDDIST